MSIEELEVGIKKLPLRARVALARWPVESLDELSASKIEALWAEEVEHRLDELEQELVTESRVEDVLRRARAAQRNVRGINTMRLQTRLWAGMTYEKG